MLFIALISANAYAQSTQPSLEKLNNSRTSANSMMMQYDFDNDDQVTEKEFIIGDGESGYRAHVSNVYQIISDDRKKDFSKQRYWFIEATHPDEYKKDLVDYFQYLDDDRDGYISTEEYQKTFTGAYISTFGKKYAQAIDADGDGRISQDEYTNFDFTSLPSGSSELFRIIDLNQDKMLIVDEFKQFFEKRF
jgi:Ca2+-binding EF-hand superfamily protein